MKKTRYWVVGVWCALLVGFVAAHGSTAFAAGSVNVPVNPGVVSGQGKLAFSSSAPVLLADAGDPGEYGGPCDPQDFPNGWCDPSGNLTCNSDNTCVGNGSVGASCDGPGDLSCSSGTCDLDTGYCPASSTSASGGGTPGELNGPCDTSDTSDSGWPNGCDPSSNLVCNSSNVCVPNSTSDSDIGKACTDASGCNTGEQCSNYQCSTNDYGQACASATDCDSGESCVNYQCTSSSANDIGKACTDASGCNTGEQCSNYQCSTNDYGQACASATDCDSGESCVNYQCAASGGGSGTVKPTGGGTGSGGSTTRTVSGASGTALGPNGSTNILGSNGQVIGNAPAGSKVSINPATGVATITTPSTSTSSPGTGTNSGIGATPGVCGAGLGAFDSISLFPKICSFNSLVLAIVNVLLSVLAIIAALYIIIGGFRYVTSNGNEEGAKKGLATVKNAAIGLAIAILAYAIIAVVVNTASSLGGSSSSGSSSSTTTTSSGAIPGQ